jgi:hypothetical protein
MTLHVSIRPLQEGDLDTADRVMRMAFGTFLGAPDPMMVFGDADYVRSRFVAEPSWAFAADLDGEVVGSNSATRWGSFGFFGPLTVRENRRGGQRRVLYQVGAVRPGPDAGEHFERLLDACEDLAGERGVERIIAGVNVARHNAYRRLLARGYRTFLQGVAMQRPNEPGYCRPNVYVIDDLR